MDGQKKTGSPTTTELHNLRAEYNRLKQLLDSSRDVLYRMSLPNGIYEYVSPSSKDLFGYAPEEFYEDPQLIQQLLHPDWHDYFTTQWRLLVAGTIPPTYEYQIIRKSGEMRWMNQRNTLIRDEHNHPAALMGVVTDITEQKLEQESLDKRIEVLTSPLAHAEELAFTDIFNLEDIQRIQDEFAAATGVASLITSPDGAPITEHSNFCRLCDDVIRRTEKGAINCHNSDAELGRYNPDGPIIQQCKSAGLWGAGAAISIEGRHIGNWLIGQVRDSTQTDEKMREYARRIDADEETVLEAFHEVPIMSKDRFEAIAYTLFSFANQLSIYAYQNVRQARLINELQLKEKEISEHEAQLQEYQNMALLGNWYWDIASGDVTWSDEVFRIFHRDPETFVPQIDSIMSLSPWPGDRDRHTQLIDQAVKNHETGTFEQRFLRPDGSTGYYSSTFQGVYDEHDSLIAIKGTVQDITERKNAEQALKESETQLRTLIDNIPDLVWLKDPDGVYINCNPRFERFFGAPVEDIIGKTDYDFVDKETADLFRTYDKIAMESGKPTKNEEQITFAGDGHIELLETIKTPMYRSTGELAGVLGIGRDITERRLAEEQLQIRERMDSVGTLAGGIAHDFNNLLVGIMGNLDLVLMEKDHFGPEQVDNLKEAYELSGKAARLIQSLLSLTNTTASKLTSVDIHTVATEVFSILSRTTDRLIEKRINLSPGMFMVRGHHDQLHQVLLNLGTNAVHAIEEKGVQPGDYIAISASYCECNKSMFGGTDRACIHIVFEDSGAGMTEDVRRRAFEPLFSTKQRSIQKGQGLGLAMAYNIITRSHTGMIEIESAPGEGTKFHLYLPKATTARETHVELKTEISGGSETILIVEDENSVVRLVEKALSKYGYTVIAAEDGETGLKVYREQHETIDLVILDLSLPKLSGEMVLKGILEINPDAKVIISSGQNPPASSTLDKANASVAKPYQLKKLIDAIRIVLEY